MFAERLKQIIGSPLVDTNRDNMNLERLTELAADLPIVEFEGGYVKTSQGVQQERGIAAHLNRNAGKYVGTAIATPIVGLPIGALIDRARRKKNKLKTRLEPTQPDSLGKGPTFSESHV